MLSSSAHHDSEKLERSLGKELIKTYRNLEEISDNRLLHLVED